MSCEGDRLGMKDDHVLKVVGLEEILQAAAANGSDKVSRTRKKKKKKRKPDIVSSTSTPASSCSSSPAASVSLLDKRWFSVYDVFRCKQLHVELSALTVSSHCRYTRSRSKSRKSKDKERSSGSENSTNSVEEDRQLAVVAQREVSDCHQCRREIENGSSRASRPSEEEERRIVVVRGDEQQQQQQQRDRKKAELCRRMEMVRRLQSNDSDEQASAAAEIRAACRRDGDARTTLALMGAIPPLVAMLDSISSAAAAAGLAALLNLSVRNDQNKAAIVSAGSVAKILRLLNKDHPQHLRILILETSVAALLSLSALDANKHPIAAIPGAAAALVAAVLDDSGTLSTAIRRDAMAALYNLSLCLPNAPALVSAATVPAVLSAAYEPELCSRAVATAANLVSSPHGRRALAGVADSCLVFVDILNWGRCGYCPAAAASPYRGDAGGTVTRGLIERAVYVVMVLAQCSQSQRRAMCRAGSSSVLLELVLVGSPAVQDRASRTLQFLAAAATEDNSSTAYCCLLLEGDDGDQRKQLVERELYSEERRAVNRLVEQSLKINMQRITERACIPLAASGASSSSSSSSSTCQLVTSYSS